MQRNSKRLSPFKTVGSEGAKWNAEADWTMNGKEKSKKFINKVEFEPTHSNREKRNRVCAGEYWITRWRNPPAENPRLQ